MSAIPSKKITFKIFRFNSETDYLPTYIDYVVDVTHENVVLDILTTIKNEMDGSLSYRRSCRHGICGICSVKVNGKAILACKQNVLQMTETYGDTLTIEPLSIKRAMKDLIIDKEDFWVKHAAVKPFLDADVEDAPENEHFVSPAQVDQLLEADYCIQCGACHYSCPSLEISDAFMGPAAFAAAYRFQADVRDDQTNERLNLVNQEESGIWDCVKCMECAEVCPKDVNPIEKITKLHNMVFEAGIAKNNIATRHAVYFKDSIKKHGQLNEAGLVIYSEKGYGMYKHLKVGMQMIAKGKAGINPYSVPKSDKMDEIAKLVKISSTSKF
ncbi:MAG TPA: succinate dehydrogenase iron-sulfur subunit [Sulfurimonas sp.]|nr:succinate dehydrogenase iron-sulfur subunit [Sulfurimonas sp.]